MTKINQHEKGISCLLFFSASLHDLELWSLARICLYSSLPFLFLLPFILSFDSIEEQHEQDEARLDARLDARLLLLENMRQAERVLLFRDLRSEPVGRGG